MMLGWRKLFLRSRGERTSLLDADEFNAVLARERSRADRAKSRFSLVTLNPATELQRAGWRAIDEIFRNRRRATDTTGRTHDGRIAIVLPDTNRAQAEVLAEFLCDALAAREIACTFTISVYPNTES